MVSSSANSHRLAAKSFVARARLLQIQTGASCWCGSRALATKDVRSVGVAPSRRRMFVLWELRPRDEGGSMPASPAWSLSSQVLQFSAEEFKKVMKSFVARARLLQIQTGVSCWCGSCALATKDVCSVGVAPSRRRMFVLWESRPRDKGGSMPAGPASDMAKNNFPARYILTVSFAAAAR